jgi:CRP/FNR family cyclic AMP-dependent transcriptional regulator
MPTPAKTRTKPAAAGQAKVALARDLIGSALGFRDCPADVLDELVAAGQLRHLARGEFAVQQGAPARNVWMVVSGLLEGSMLHGNGQRHLLGLAPPGAFFSLMSVVDDLVEGHAVHARAPSVVMAFPYAVLRPMRAREPSLVLACERQIVFRSRLYLRRMATSPGVPVEVRTADMLCMLATLYGRAAGTGVELSVKLSQFDMADWLGMSRQRVNFALKQFEAEGLIRLRYSAITIIDPTGLEARARS